MFLRRNNKSRNGFRVVAPAPLDLPSEPSSLTSFFVFSLRFPFSFVNGTTFYLHNILFTTKNIRNEIIYNKNTKKSATHSHYLLTSIETSPSSVAGGAGDWRHGERRDGGGAGDRDRLRRGDVGVGSSEHRAARRLVEGSGDCLQGGEGGIRSSCLGGAISASAPMTVALPTTSSVLLDSGPGIPSGTCGACGAGLPSGPGDGSLTDLLGSSPVVARVSIVLGSMGQMLVEVVGGGTEEAGTCGEGARP